MTSASQEEDEKVICAVQFPKTKWAKNKHLPIDFTFQ